jgi:hypothetical protein
MKNILPKVLEEGRVEGTTDWGAYGGFLIQGPCGEKLLIVASGADDDDVAAEGWEHVSVSVKRRVPNWQEMCFVKDLFWFEEECVVQFHPPKSEYVNNHPYVLHLWRHKDGFPMPPSILVGIKSRGVLTRDEAVELRRQIFGKMQ